VKRLPLTADPKAPHSQIGGGRAPNRHGPHRAERKLIMMVYMTIEEVARSLRVSVPTVRWLRQKGRFAPAIKIGRRVVWDEKALEAWVEANREAAA
jgi:excisionase family DNA binding protein